MKLLYYFSALFLFSSSLSLASSPAAAKPSEQPTPNSLQALELDANKGDAYAARQLYMRYSASGQPETASKWATRYADILKEKAKSGDSKAMLRLGSSYLKGSDQFPWDREQALLWFSTASASGEPSAAYILAELYKEDPDKSLAQQHYARAYELYSQQAEQEATKADALYWLGMMQLYGQGTELDIEAGLGKMESAASLKNKWAYTQLFKIFAEGQAVERDEKRAIGYAQVLADEFKDGLMAYAVACAYLNGQGVEQNIELGEQYLAQACSSNIADAITLHASRLEQAGKAAEALPFYQQAASMGQEQALTRLGVLMIKGEGIDKDEEQGVALLKTAAERFQSKLAPLELALYYEAAGEQSLADYWYVSASDRGVAQAMARRGLLHLNPNSDMDWNPTLSYRWWKAGSDADDAKCSTYINIFIFGFIPFVLIVCFLGPVLIVRFLNKRADAKENQG